MSLDVADADMTAERIVETALARRIGLLAVTDHNAIDSVRSLLLYGASAGLAVMCGVEISATEGHLLVYFDASQLEAFEEWFHAIRFEKDESSGDRWTLTPMHELIATVSAAGGIAVPAHVGRRKSGFAAKAAVKAQDAILVSAGLLAIEVNEPEEFGWFTPEDSGPGSGERKRQMQLRSTKLGDGGARLAKLRFSDAHRIDQIGRNADGQERLTRIKMSVPSFEGFRTALMDSDARVRLEDQLPASYPRLVGARFRGGFLDGQELRFSPNLTCLIGGRGTGKSTALNSVRCACLNSDDKDANSPHRPQTLQLIYDDEFGETHYLVRDAGGRTMEQTPNGPVETALPVDGYAQNRVTEITDSYGSDPLPLLAFLDSFADLDDPEDELSHLRQRLVDNANKLEPVANAAARRKEAETSQLDATTKLGAIERSKFKLAFEWKQKLDQERVLRAAVKTRLGIIQSQIEALDVTASVGELAVEAHIPDLGQLPSHEQLVGKGEADGLSQRIDAAVASLVAWREEGLEILSEQFPELERLVSDWERRDQQVEAHFQKVVDELRGQGIAPDILAAITRLMNQQRTAQASIERAADDEALRLDLVRERAALLVSLKAAQGKRFYNRQAAMVRLTDLLNSAIEDFRVKIAFDRGVLRDGFVEWLQAALNNRFFRGERLAAFCQLMHPVELAAWVKAKNFPKFVALTDADGRAFFGSKDDALAFITQLSGADLHALETVEITDRPTILITTDLAGSPTTVPFENLSLGQKASVLLAALLFADDHTPLIIDQPEDHLDSRFIFGTVVANLRYVKEKRQVIVATHNANIAVLAWIHRSVRGLEWSDLPSRA